MIAVPGEALRWARHLALAGMAASFPLLYMGAVTLESAAVTAAGIVVACVVALIAWVAF